MLCYENKSVSKWLLLVSDPYSLNGARRELLLSCHALVCLEGAFWEAGATCALWCSRAYDRNNYYGRFYTSWCLNKPRRKGLI